MKKIYTFLIAVTISVSAFAQIPSYVPTSGLQGCWLFNGNANDLSSMGNNGSVTGASLTTDRFGVANKAYSFNGGSYIEVPHSSSLYFAPDEFTISFWMNSSNYSSGFLFEKCSGLGATNTGPMISVGSNNLTYMYSDAATTGGWGTLTSPSLPTINTWFHVVLTTNNGFDKMYINGVLVAFNTVGHNKHLGANTVPLRFGYGPPQNAYGYTGKMDDILIYNRALTASEVTDLYNSIDCSAPQPHANDVSLCGGGVTTLTATGGSNYIWYSVPTGGTQISSGATYTTPFLTSTTTYYVSNFDGTCESTRDTVVVTFVPLPSVTFTGLSSGYCQNSSPISLIGSPSGGTFSGTGVTGSIFTPALVTSGSTTITYSYTDPVTTCSKTINQSVSVYSIPSVSFTGLNANFNQNDPPVTLIGTPTSGTFSGSGIIGNTFNPSIAGVGAHNIVYIYSDSHSCINAICETTDITTYMKTISNVGNIEISIYPNPSIGTFNLAFVLDNSENVNIQVVNNLGEVVYKESKNNIIGNYNNMINLSNLTNGIFTLTVKIGNSVSSEKISIMK